MGKLFIGTSGFNYKDWKEKFYPREIPQKAWLSFYARHFNSVEINATFYGSFKKETIVNWYAQTPQDFTFAVKGSRFITHIKRLKVTEEEISRFFEQVAPLREKLSCILWQFPANFLCNKETYNRLQKFLQTLPAAMRHAFELRHASWFSESVWELLNMYGAGYVVSDTQAFPVSEKITDGFAYIRFHGPTSLYSSKYSQDQLSMWAEKILPFLKTTDVYCYFNNDVSGYAIENAQTLRTLIQRRD